MKKSGILRIIREEVEVVLTNEEAIEMFDLGPAALEELEEKRMDIKGMNLKKGKNPHGPG